MKKGEQGETYWWQRMPKNSDGIDMKVSVISDYAKMSEVREPTFPSIE